MWCTCWHKLHQTKAQISRPNPSGWMIFTILQTSLKYSTGTKHNSLLRCQPSTISIGRFLDAKLFFKSLCHWLTHSIHHTTFLILLSIFLFIHIFIDFWTRRKLRTIFGSIFCKLFNVHRFKDTTVAIFGF